MHNRSHCYNQKLDITEQDHGEQSLEDKSNSGRDFDSIHQKCIQDPQHKYVNQHQDVLEYQGNIYRYRW
jgi:hypothetical protein